jgi:hypothetical protein
MVWKDWKKELSTEPLAVLPQAVMGTPVQNGHPVILKARLIFLQAAVRFPPESLSEITGVHTETRYSYHGLLQRDTLRFTKALPARPLHDQ